MEGAPIVLRWSSTKRLEFVAEVGVAGESEFANDRLIGIAGAEQGFGFRDPQLSGPSFGRFAETLGENSLQLPKRDRPKSRHSGGSILRLRGEFFDPVKGYQI